MYPFTGKAVLYAKAQELIRFKVKDTLLQKQMLYPLRKTSDSAGVSTAVQKLKEHFSDVNDRRKKKIFAKFDELGISPVTKPKG